MTTVGPNVSQRVREYIVNSFLLGEDDGLSDTASLLEQGVVDSLGLVELVLFVEEEFEISLEEEELTNENLDSIERVSRLVEAKMGISRNGIDRAEG
ncbi:phosphopantetheine-binding protein [Micromonospora sp. NPDC005652]|uniref:phosphopantetheine-binding protein n=1 Tax=Micromonospora sp. NPDC005652 TaxID=3157046 RepID=UPI0034017A61